MTVTINGNGAISGLVITTADLSDGSVTTAKIADANVTTAKIADSAITSGKIADGAVATADIADSAVTTAKIANANVTVAKLSATGTPSSTTFLRGDGSWQAVSSTPTTAQVLTATAGASAGAVGTYVFRVAGGSGGWSSGSTVAGSTFGFSGTWRAMGGATTVTDYYNNNCSISPAMGGIYLRIS